MSHPERCTPAGARCPQCDENCPHCRYTPGCWREYFAQEGEHHEDTRLYKLSDEVELVLKFAQAAALGLTIGGNLETDNNPRGEELIEPLAELVEELIDEAARRFRRYDDAVEAIVGSRVYAGHGSLEPREEKKDPQDTAKESQDVPQEPELSELSPSKKVLIH